MTAAARAIRLAPAKLNLTLAVTGRRADGYHLLDSLVAFTELGDRIEAVEADRLGLEIDGPFAPALASAGDDNLVLRAARRLAEFAGIRPRARIRLTKHLPVASGIGGGSSDAAATLLALDRVWRLDLDAAALARLGLELGADLPVCLGGRPARLRGIGEIVTPAPALPPAPVVLVNPGVALPTPAVFKARQGAFSAGAGAAGVPPAPVAEVADLARHLADHPNDLTEAAIALAPEIALALHALEIAPGCLLARMSGSGATCFALFEHANEAAASAEALARRRPRWWVQATRLAPGSPPPQLEAGPVPG